MSEIPAPFIDELQAILHKQFGSENSLEDTKEIAGALVDLYTLIARLKDRSDLPPYEGRTFRSTPDPFDDF